ncbi:type III secretion system YscI/HrpB-like protein [Pseudomonas sp. JAI115]|uniref:type III secretion system inner rod subunit SctI n=1 Tax=Pseudomonas sp. JAI115 TaxID=2723061 RepID=UPI00160AE4DD|nr:type III secretion system inner rod subunit SctI [Pseudomonas sp. JAI115]MBB6155184.1 type III secretion system YscI/HrpB-like protein [Pseudomonas sp. JAI115]
MPIDAPAFSAAFPPLPDASCSTSASSATSSLCAPSSVPAADVEAFSQALFGRRPAPERVALTQLQEASQTLNSALANAKHASLDNPLKMLGVQSQMLNSIFEVDLLAKTAGGVTQGINKLVSMQ